MTDEGVSTGRRAYLRRAALAAVTGLAGCASLGGGTPTDRDTPTATPTADPTATPTADPTATDTPSLSPAPSPTPTPEPLANVSGTYPSVRYDAGRRAFAPGVTGPVESPTVAYTLELSGEVYQPVVDGVSLYLARRRPDPGEPTVESFDLRRGTREWDVDLGSQASGAPSVVGDRAFVQTADGIYGLAPDGSVEWSSGAVSNTGFTPTAVGERVYAAGESGLTAYDADGERAWGVPLTTLPLAAAAADESTVYLSLPRDQLTTDVLALDADDGGTAWRTSVEIEAGFPPVRAGDAVYVTSDRRQGGVTALAADDGSELWTADVELDYGTAVTADRVVVAAGERVVARSRTDGSADWSTPVGADVVAGPVAGRDAVYVGIDTDDGGAVHALSLDDGGGRWTLGFDRPVGTPVVVENGVVVPTRDGEAGAERLHVATGP